MAEPVIIAIPKGRILEEALPLLARAGIVPEAAFSDEGSRALRFATNRPDISIIRVRAFDVATFVAHGAAQIGIVGSDVLLEFDYSELYAPVDLDIGHCRLSVAEPVAMAAGDDPREWSHVRVATKYPNLTRKHFEARGVQAECVKLNGAMEIAPLLGPHAQGQWAGRGRDHHPGVSAARGQPRRFQDARGGDRAAGRGVPRRRGHRRCRLGSTPVSPVSRRPSTRWSTPGARRTRTYPPPSARSSRG
jgi:ATP phosphoribosyltransferase